MGTPCDGRFAVAVDTPEWSGLFAAVAVNVRRSRARQLPHVDGSGRRCRGHFFGRAAVDCVGADRGYRCPRVGPRRGPAGVVRRDGRWPQVQLPAGQNAECHASTVLADLKNFSSSPRHAAT